VSGKRITAGFWVFELCDDGNLRFLSEESHPLEFSGYMVSEEDRIVRIGDLEEPLADSRSVNVDGETDPDDADAPGSNSISGIDKAARIEVVRFDPTNGSKTGTVSITAETDIKHIVDNLNALSLQKMDYNKPTVREYELTFYHANGEITQQLSISVNGWVGFDGYYHVITYGKLDRTYLSGLLNNAIAGFDFSFPAEMAGSIVFGHTTPSSILAHYFSEEFEGYVDFVKFLDENNAYDSISKDDYDYEQNIILVNDIEVHVLSAVNEESGVKNKLIAYWKVDEWCYEMNAHFAPNCSFDTILERFVQSSKS
jgi:hypothetical protein